MKVIERSDYMCVQVIQNQNDFLDTRITNVYKVLNLLGPIYCRALYADVHMPGCTSIVFCEVAIRFF